MKYYVCFDIGGSSTKCGLLNENGNILQKGSYPFAQDLNGLIHNMKSFYQIFSNEYPISGIAISSCGSVDCETGIIGGISAVPYIHGFSWKELIQKEFGLPCEIENDANCAALSEVYFGNAKSVKEMAFFVIGTGVGGSIVRNGKVLHGAHRYGGEFGMMLSEDESGNIVNFSLLASTSSMVRKMEQITKESWNGKKIFEEAENGNEICQNVIQKFFHQLALGVFNVQHSLDPDMILFGGGISEREDFVTRLMEEYKNIAKKVDFDTIDPQLCSCTFKQDSNLIGALANFVSKSV